MRKIFSLLTAILLAGSMMADSFAPKAFADITADDVVIVTMTNASGTYALANDKGTSNPPTAVPVTVTDGKISTDATTILWQVVKDGDSFMLKAGESNLYCTNTNNGVRVGTSNGVFTISNDYLCCTSTSSNRYLGVYSSQDWRCYTTINSNISGQTLAFYVKEGAAPTTKYYMKNNWNLGDWAWKEMTKDGDNYKLENVVFGGTGVNYNTSESDQGATWVPVADIACDNLAAKDTVNFVLAPAAGTVTATIVGKYVEPIDPQTKDIQVVPGAWADYKLAAWAWEGSAEGAWYPVVAKNEQMIAEVPAAADHIIIVAFETTAEEFDWNTKIAQTSNQDIDACGVIYINNGNPTWCQPAEIVAEVYTVAGSSSILGVEWDTEATENDMTLNPQTGVYTLVKEGLTLAAFSYPYKVVKNHAWGTGEYPTSGNNTLNIPEDGVYTVTFTYNPNLATPVLTAEAVKTGDAEIERHYLVVGQGMVANGEDWNNDAEANLMTTADEGLTYTLTIADLQLIAGTDYRYKIVEKGTWDEYFPNLEGPDATFSVATDGIYTITYVYTVANEECTVQTNRTGDLPEPTLTNGYYIIGKFAGVEDWTVAGLTEAHRFILQNETEEGAFYQLTNVPLAVGDSFKVVSVKHDIIVRTWPEGSTEGVVIDANHAGEAKTIYLSFLTTGKWYCNVEPNIYDGYYLVGNIGGVETWTPVAANRFSVTEEEGEFLLHYTLAENDRIKVGYAYNGVITTWYPDGTDNEYVVDANHAGEKDIYFRPIYKAEWEEFGGHIWMGSNEPPVVEKYCEKPSGHLNDPNFGDASGRILLTIEKGEGNNIVVKIKNNNEAGNTHTGLNYLWVNAEGATGGVVRYGDGTHAEADVEEVSVIVPFEEARESYNFTNIHWAYSGWDGEWAIDGLTVSADELCEGAGPVEPTLANGFYLIGQNGWDVAALSADLLFAANPDTEGEYKLTATLAVGQGIKVVKVENDAIVAWYPDGMDNEYTVDAAHAGSSKDIYFQETYKADWAAFGGYFWTGSNEPTAISNTAVDAKAEKILRNGMILIIKGDKTYNVMGQIVK